MSKTRRITVTLSEEVGQAIEKAAKEEGRTVSAEIEVVVGSFYLTSPNPLKVLKSLAVAEMITPEELMSRLIQKYMGDRENSNCNRDN